MRAAPISLIMAVHNQASYLRESIESLLAQSCGDFELIIVDDASTDASRDLLDEYAHRDGRIELVRNATNLGLTRALNVGLARARGAFIARQDADDVSLAPRLAAQMRFLSQHEDVGLLGTAYVLMDHRGNLGEVVHPPPTDTGIRWRMLFHNAFCHSSVMLRRESLRHAIGGYDPALGCAQDYDLWVRVLSRTTGANLPEPLVRLRIHEESISAIRRTEQTHICTTIAARQIAELVPSLELSHGQVQRLRDWCARFCDPTLESDPWLCRTFLEILAAFIAQPGVNRDVAARIASCWRERVRSSVGEVTWLQLSLNPAHVSEGCL